MSERINNCYFNIDGMCTHPKPYSTFVGFSGRVLDSKESCTFTQYGAQKICTDYKLED